MDGCERVNPARDRDPDVEPGFAAACGGVLMNGSGGSERRTGRRSVRLSAYAVRAR